jgi:ABC-type microcin C transport system permease subunit YejE
MKFQKDKHGIWLFDLFLIVLLFVLTFFAITGCNDNPVLQREQSITGTITVTGNVPFTKLSLRTDYNKIYILKCTQPLESQLWKMQGARVTVYYSRIIIDEFGIPTLDVIKVVIIYE